MSRRKSGGREARIALRNAPLKEEEKPVHAGEIGGRYKPLSDKQVKAIEANIYRILEEVGFADATPHCIEACLSFGATLGDDGRLRMSKQVVDKAINLSQRNLTLYGQSPKHDLDLSGSRVHFSTAGAAVLIADPENNEYRESESQDLYDMARIADKCEHIHMFQRTCVLRDIDNPREMDQNSVYCVAMGTEKHAGVSFTESKHVTDALEMLHIISGSEEKWRERPFISMSNCHVVPPMKFAEESLECLRVGVEGGMPVLLLSAGQAGATAPPLLPGVVSQAWAECLGGLVYVNAIKPGAPAILGTWPFVSDLRTGAMCGGSPEQGLISAACAQMGNYFNLPTGTPAGMTDSKFPDFQAGSERASTHAVTAIAGANIIYESAGMYASLLGTCPESLLLDNDLLGASMRMTKGFSDDSEESLCFETIKDVCLNDKAHYLGSEQTIDVMQSEYIYPDLSDRDSPNDWADMGKPVILEKAIEQKNEILSEYFPSHISDETDQKVREKFNIKLSRNNIGRKPL
ncbi:MAG: trimethylamine methyltransferase family protein [Pseudomonadota bacterium]|nr:trimethylamine methyltransferase family protein [Pseudomonadota bacterium]